MDYDTLRHFADTWGLLALTLLFVGIVLWAYWPRRKRELWGVRTAR